MRAVGAAKHWLDNPPVVEPLRLRTAPMLAAAACFALGILLARTRWHPPAQLAAQTLALLAIAAIALHRKQRLAIAAVLALWLAAGCWCAQVEPPLPQQTALRPYADGLSREVQGRVLRIRPLHAAPDTDDPNEPEDWEQPHGPAKESVDLAITAVEDVTPDTSTLRPITGGVRITLLGDDTPLHCGDQITLPLRLRLPDDLRTPGAWSSADLLASENISTLASARSDSLTVQGAPKPTWACRLIVAQTWAATRLHDFAASHANRTLPTALRLDANDTAMLSAMLFGDRTGLTRSLREGFERTGTFHLFVVSGLHVALIAGALLWTLRRFRLPESAAVLLTLTLTSGYALLTGFGLPVQRALLMTAAYLLAQLLARESQSLNALGIAAVMTLAVDPRALFEASFQMTFLVIFAIAGLAIPLRERLHAPYAHALHNLDSTELDAALPPRLAAFRIHLRLWTQLLADLTTPRLAALPRWLLALTFRLGDALLLGLVTECCMALPMAVVFHRATLFAMPVNALAIPLIGFVLAGAVATFVLLLANPWAALPASALTALSLHLIRWVVTHASRATAADIRIPAPAPAILALAGATLAFAGWALRTRRRALVLTGACAVLLAPLLTLYPEPPLLHPNQLEVTALDVGQGDSLLVVTPDGHTLLVDAGGPTGGTTPSQNWDIGEDVVAPYLWSRRLRRLDAMLLTHAHSDHMGGMPAVLRDLRPRELWLGAEPGQSPGLRALEHEATALNITIRRFRAGDAFPWGNTQARVLAPEVSYTNPGTPVNNDSLVLELQFGQSRALLEGDAEASSEAAMLANHRVLPATLLKVAHHGSKTSTNPAFLAAVAPRDAVISVGRHNTFGHPRYDVLERLQSAGVRTFRTDRQGAETFLLDANGNIALAAP